MLNCNYFSAILVCALLFAQPAHIHAQEYEAQGNVGFVIAVNSALSTDEHPLTAKPHKLWCQAVKIADPEDRQAILTKAEFVHLTGHRSFPGTIQEGATRAYLNFNDTTVLDAGKYRCKLTTENDRHVHGNMFAYMRPVFVTQEKQFVNYVEEKENFTVIGKPVKVSPKGKAVLHCPVLGYPVPSISWFKDGLKIEESDKIKFIGPVGLKEPTYTLEIHDAEPSDEGHYHCLATNEFPTDVMAGEPKFQFQSVLEQRLYVSSGYAWIYPLIVILIILILLVLVIYCCAYCKRRVGHSDNYDVAKREKTLRAVEEQRLNEDSDADY